MSVAEKTMQRHQVRECWGCGSPGHVYSDRSGTIFCPRASEPEVKAKFDATRKEFQDRRKAHTKKTLEKRKSNSLLSTFLQDIDMEQLKAFVSNKKLKPTDSSKQVQFITLPTFLCLPTDITSKPFLPISVDTNLPHFLLDVSQTNADTSFKLSVAYDTCAALCVGWSGFHLAVAKAFPHLVKSLVWAKDEYTPLTLSGIVSNKEGETTKTDSWLVTTLLAVIEYYMPPSNTICCTPASKAILPLSKWLLATTLPSTLCSA
jgi:uncharacterized Zn finger protein (UPF0148 family)